MSLVINALRDGHTHTHASMRTKAIQDTKCVAGIHQTCREHVELLFQLYLSVTTTVILKEGNMSINGSNA